MDRFKFRVWNNKIKEFVNPMDWSYWDLCFWYEPYEQDIEPVLMDMDYYEIEQCTGLKDKNGKLIYEHDYVMINKIIYKVFWNKTKISLANILNGDIIDFIETEEMEIIGNEHEETNIRKI